ncbi:hypothetical protein [Streptomyces sp. NPDC047108]|uniref:hypothetical protein n=1 Tax=Streptomyces sp. NPDC047108 TaxID=3155025 RepID=UPI0033E6BF27
MPSLPLTLTARLLPVAVLATAGWAMARPAEEARSDSPASDKERTAAAAPTIAGPPADACTAIPAATVKELVPGAKTEGKELGTSDPKRRTGCAWNALKGFDYRWLDVTFEITDAKSARAVYADREQAGVTEDLGDEASTGSKITKDDGQETREVTIIVRKANALVTVVYNGADFDNEKAPGAGEMEKGATSAAKVALSALKS